MVTAAEVHVCCFWLGSKDGVGGRPCVSKLVERNGSLVAYYGKTGNQWFAQRDATWLPAIATFINCFLPELDEAKASRYSRMENTGRMDMANLTMVYDKWQRLKKRIW